MTTFPYLDIRASLELIKDRTALEVIHRVVQAEAVFHESRLAQIKELDQEIAKRLKGMRD